MARSTLEDFVIEGKLGTGSFGTVYRVTRTADQQQYALKEIDLRCMSEQEQEDCIKECSVLAALDSPYIIKFYDSFLQKGKLYICMEYASGGNLYEYIHKQTEQLPEERVWQLFIQMLLGLNFMHGRKILHRDFKTLNVFLDDKFNVRLGDLGVAKVLSDESMHARTMIGTPYYLSPEMCEDKPYNEKSDVWALGVGLYECCARKHPFDAENQGSLILKILRGKYPPLTGYSKDLTDIVKSCLTLDASKRPGTNSLLALKPVRERAKQLEIELPLPLPSPSKPPLAAKAPSRPSLIAAKSFQSRRARDSDAAAQQPSAAAAANRSPTPPLVQRTPSARVLAAVSKVDIAADLQLGSRAAAGSKAAGSRRASATDEAPGALPAGQVQKQLQGMKLTPSVSARRCSADHAGASSPEPPATNCAVSECAGSSSSSSSAQEGSSQDATPPATERSHRMQRSLPEVKKQIIERVGPLAYDALHSTIMAFAQAGGSEGPAAQPPSLLAAVQRMIPSSQAAAVLPLLVKLMYLETQVDDEAAAAGGSACDWQI